MSEPPPTSEAVGSSGTGPPVAGNGVGTAPPPPPSHNAPPVPQIPPRHASPVRTPHPHDVLFGRDGRINSHPGNVRFREVVDVHKRDYLDVLARRGLELDRRTKKAEKARIAARIVRGVRSMDPPGRFLQEDPRTGLWAEIGDERARKKAGRALRESAPEIIPAERQAQPQMPAGVPTTGAAAVGAPALAGIPAHISIINDSRKPTKESMDVDTKESVGVVACLENQWMENTRFLDYLKLFRACFDSSPSLLRICNDRAAVENIIRELTRRSGQFDAYAAQNVLRRLYQVGDGKRRNRQNIALAYLLLLKYESADGRWALGERVGERVHRCESAQKQAYVIAIQQAAHAFETQQLENTSATKWDSIIPNINELRSRTQQQDSDFFSPAGNLIECQLSAGHLMEIGRRGEEKSNRATHDHAKALRSIHVMIGDYLDTHKENAFKSALHEPARFYFDLCGNDHHRDHVNVHGLNGWLCLIRGWFGCQLPMIPMPDDEDTFKGCADVWRGLSEDAWRVFCDPANFGKDFEGMRGLNRGMLKTRRYGGYPADRRFIGRKAGDMERDAKRKAKRFRRYAEKFEFFFSKDFLVKRMFEVLNAEEKPEYIGFKRACNVLFPLFREEYRISDESILEYLYDEYMMNIDIERAAFFFWWCGVCKKSCVDAQIIRKTQNVQEDDKAHCAGKSDVCQVCEDNICPICFEEKPDIKQIPHWEAAGDVSGHKMCADCAALWPKNECPFCKEVSLKEGILSCINDFIGQIRTRSANGDPNQLAAVLEHWQFFEMEYGDNPKVIYRVAMLIIRDQEFRGLLENGVSSRSPWMRDAAGIIFRLYSLAMEGNLKVSHQEKALLANCYSTILDLMKAREVQNQGHFHGALYSQAMVPYICALQSGQSTTQLEIIVRDVGNLIVYQYKCHRRSHPGLKWQIPQRIVPEYMSIVTSNVWGGECNDPVWKAFYRR